MCVALPGKVTWIGRGAPGTIPARVDLPTGVVDADLVLVPDAQVGDFVITHAGFALRLLSEQEAEETLRVAGLNLN